jgi:hypothetical protein
MGLVVGGHDGGGGCTTAAEGVERRGAVVARGSDKGIPQTSSSDMSQCDPTH